MPTSDDRDRRARRRAVIRRHHPDVGGSAQDLVAALEGLDERPVVEVAHSWRGRLRKALRRAGRGRGKPPRRLL